LKLSGAVPANWQACGAPERSSTNVRCGRPVDYELDSRKRLSQPSPDN
jgi:hypothetical protein